MLSPAPNRTQLGRAEKEANPDLGEAFEGRSGNCGWSGDRTLVTGELLISLSWMCFPLQSETGNALIELKVNLFLSDHFTATVVPAV
jgi:hypothetical protein